jgi:hypothetical protein
MVWQEVPKRVFMVCAVAQSRLVPCNESLAIAIITPLPGNALNFAVVREVLREFLVDHERVPILDIQPTHLGQAFVCFASNHIRDSFVLESLHPFDDVNISFACHNQGRRVNFNCEVMLMLLGLHADYWEDGYVE